MRKYGILKDVAILNLKPSKMFLNGSGLSGLPVDTYASETAADAIIWEAFAKRSADTHESSQLIHYYL